MLSWLWKPGQLLTGCCWHSYWQHEENQAFVTEIFKNTWEISFPLRQTTLFHHCSSPNLLLICDWCRGLEVRVVCLCVWEILQQTQSLKNIYCKCSGPAKWSAVLSETTHTHCPPELLPYFFSSALRWMEFGKTESTFANGTEINVRLQILRFYLRKPILHHNGGTKLVQFLLYDWDVLRNTEMLMLPAAFKICASFWLWVSVF